MQEKSKKEIIYKKYNQRGADYHWKQINKRSFFGFNAFVYARYFFFAQELKKIYPSELCLKIIDFGCGDGVQLHFVNEALKRNVKNRELTGIDLSSEALMIARQKLQGEFIHRSVYETGLPPETFDVCISSDVIEHVQNPHDMIAEMIRVTKKDGIIIIGTPIKTTEVPMDPMHVQEFFQEEFKKLFINDSLEILDHAETHNLLYYLAYIDTQKIFHLEIMLYRYIINIMSLLFGINPFLMKRKAKNDHMSYQFILMRRK